ncbi:MAG: toxin VasX [Bacteroidales bacterium]
MGEQKKTVFSLNAEGRGVKAEGTKLKVVDNVRLYLSLYRVYNKNTSKSGFISPLNKQTVEYVPTPDGFPDISQYGYFYYMDTLKKGYIYVYFESYNRDGIFKEYEITDDGLLVDLIWSDPDDNSVSWSKPKNSNIGGYVKLRKKTHKKVWIVYSPVRWSEDYAYKVLNNEKERNKRMQCLNCEDCFSGIFDNNGHAIEQVEQLMTVTPPFHSGYLKNQPFDNNNDYQQWNSLFAKSYFNRQEENYNRSCALKKGDNDNSDFYFALYDPQGIADALCLDKGIELECLNDMVQSMKDVARVNSSDSLSPEEESELSALIDLGVIIHRMLNTKTGTFTKYKSHVSEELIKKVLLVEERKRQRRKINNITYALADILKGDAYQLSCLDYIVDDQRTNQEGKSRFCSHLRILALEPESIDGHFNNPVVEMVIDSRIRTCVNTILSENNNTGILLRQAWDLDYIVSVSVSLSTKSASSLEDVVQSLMHAIGYLSESSRASVILEALNFKSKDGQQYIKLPESKIPDELKKRIDYSKLKTTTIKGQGKGFLIRLDDVTYNGSKISGGSSVYRGKNVSITLETVMPNWKEQLLKVNRRSDNWAKGFDKFISQPSFLRAMSGVALLNLTLVIKKNEKSWIDYLDFMGTTAYLLAMHQKAVQLYTPQFMGKFVSKSVLSNATTYLFIASSLLDGLNLYRKNQITAGVLQVLSGVTGIFALGFSGIYGWALIAISIALAIIVEAIRDTDLQLLLKNCAYGNNRQLMAQSGRELLGKAEKVKESNAELKRYIHDQQHTLNSLMYVMQGAINARIKMVYDFKIRWAGPTLIKESTELKYIDIECGIWCSSLLSGTIRISIAMLDAKRSLLKYVEIEDNSEVEIDAEQGIVKIRYNVNRQTAAVFRGCSELKIMVDVTSKDGINHPPHSNLFDIANAVAFYFPYKDQVTWSSVNGQSGGWRKDVQTSIPEITTELNNVCYSPKEKQSGSKL